MPRDVRHLRARGAADDVTHEVGERTDDGDVREGRGVADEEFLGGEIRVELREGRGEPSLGGCASRGVGGGAGGKDGGEGVEGADGELDPRVNLRRAGGVGRDGVEGRGSSALGRDCGGKGRGKG